MNAEQALQVLDQVTQNVAGTRRDHETIQQALGVLSELVQKCANCENSECKTKCQNQ